MLGTVAWAASAVIGSSLRRATVTTVPFAGGSTEQDRSCLPRTGRDTIDVVEITGGKFFYGYRIAAPKATG